MLRLPKDDRVSLARDMTLRRPVEGDGDGRKMGKRGRRWPCWGPAGALASPGAGGAGGGETGAGAAKVVPWWSAALCLRLALAAAPRWRRRACPGAGCKGGGAVAEGEDTISSLSLVLPSEVVAVRVACPPASFILVKISSSQLNSSPILYQESELNVLELEELGS